MARGRLSRGQQAQQQVSDGLAPGLQLYTPFPFGGVDAKGSPIGIADDRFAWLENVMWIGSGQLALLNGPSTAPLYTAPGGVTINGWYQYSINTIQYICVFRSDGAADQVQLSNGAITVIAVAGTFNVSDNNSLPIASGWQNKWLLIATKTAYYVWDGAVLFRPGSLGPEVAVTANGSGYTSAPAVTITGGAGAGATAVASIVNGVVTTVTMTAAGSGYAYNDLPLINFVFTGGGQTNKLAQATATVGGGGVISVNVIDGGTGYTNSPTVTFAGGGAATQATAVASGSAGQITAITVVTPGVGYTSTPSITVGAPAGGGDTATAVAVLGYNGITGITVTDAGAGYISAPSVVITDATGSGTGAVAVAVMSATNTVASVTIVNPGHGYVTPVVRFVGGNPNVATATGSIMPQGGANPVAGSAIEVFQSRVWLFSGTIRFTSAAASVTVFAASAGGVTLQNTDTYLQERITGAKQANGFIYEFGDSSINSLSPPSTTGSGSTAITAYTVTNIDAQIGCPWPETIQSFGQALIFARSDGVYAIYGSRLERISVPLDDLFATLPTQDVRATAAVATLFGIKCYILALLIADPYLNVTRRLFVCWDGEKWFFATAGSQAISQLRTLSPIIGFFFQSVLTAYGSDTHNIFQMFAMPSISLQKKIISKFYGADSAQQYKQALHFYISAEQPITYDIVIHQEVAELDLGSVTYPDTAGPSVNNAYGGRLTVMGRDVPGAYGRYLGWTLTTNTATANIDYMALAYRYHTGY